MIDIDRIRNNLNATKNALKRRSTEWIKKVDEVSKIDKKYRDILKKLESLNAKRNKISLNISKLHSKLSKKELLNLKKQASIVKNDIAKLQNCANKMFAEIKNKMLNIPNIPHSSVPFGKNELNNKEIHRWGKLPKWKFEPKAHWELARSNNLVDFERAIKLTGSRFTCYVNYGAKLLRALIQYTLDSNTKAGFQEMLPAVILNSKSLIGTGQLPKFEVDLFKLTNGYYLSPTAEVQLTNYYSNEILLEKQLPIRFTADTCCFRSEAGSAGKDTKGVIRQHQFYKTEMVILSHPKNSYVNHEFMTRQAEKLLEDLNLPYRRILLCTGDMGFGSCKTYDIEVWLPSYKSYKEISSCSNCEDFQSRRMMLRYKDKNGQNHYVHTLNGSGLAIDRLWAAVVENYQQKDGSIVIPKILQKYMNNLKVIKSGCK